MAKEASSGNGFEKLVMGLKDFGEVQQVFQRDFGVRRMIVGSSSPRRVLGLQERSIFPVEQANMNEYIEPDFTNVLEVAGHKCDYVVDKLHGHYGGPSLVVTEDALTGIYGEVLHQMRRNGSLTWTQIQEEIGRITHLLREPSKWVWNVGMVLSVKGLRLGWAREFTVSYEMIPEEVVRESFVDEIAPCQTRPPRLDLLDRLAGYATGACSRVITQERVNSGPNLEDYKWCPLDGVHGPSKCEIDMASVLKCVRYGIPVCDGLGGYLKLPNS